MLTPANHPQTEPIIGKQMIDAWHQDHYRAKANPDMPHRASDASGCWRQTAYAITDTPKTNPPTVADEWRMQMGTLIHGLFEQRYTAAGIWWERPFTLHPSTSGHGDCMTVGSGIIREGVPFGIDDKVVAAEVKSINGTGFRQLNKYGPRYAHVAQGALCAEAEGADILALIYVAVELTSPSLSAKLGLSEYDRFIAEYHFTPDEWAPYVEREQARIAEILDIIDQDGPAAVPRFYDDGEVPVGAQVTNVRLGGSSWGLHRDGELVASGKMWMCDYCSWRDRCADDGATI